jgi:hypothetical protein
VMHSGRTGQPIFVASSGCRFGWLIAPVCHAFPRSVPHEPRGRVIESEWGPTGDRLGTGWRTGGDRLGTWHGEVETIAAADNQCQQRDSVDGVRLTSHYALDLRS